LTGNALPPKAGLAGRGRPRGHRAASRRRAREPGDTKTVLKRDGVTASDSVTREGVVCHNHGVNRSEARLRGFSQTETLLKTDKATVALEAARDGKFEAKTTSWDRNATFLPGDQLRIEVVSGQLVLTRWHSEAKDRRVAAPVPAASCCR